MKHISKSVVEGAMSYEEYSQQVSDLYERHETTGNDHSEAMLHYTSLNIARMKRLDRTTTLTETSIALLNQLQTPQIWLVITEGWCGDAAQIFPLVHTMANQSPSVTLKLILRDQHLDVMDAFLTNGARSIPILLVLDASTLEVLTTWGPRPSEAQTLMVEAKKKVLDLAPEVQKAHWEQVKTDIHKWYATNKTIDTQREIVEALKKVFAESETL